MGKTKQDEVTQLVRDGVQILEDASVPAELKPAALREVLRMLAGQTSPRAEAISATFTPQPTSLAPEEAFAGLAQRVGVPLTVLSDLFHLEAGELSLAVPSRKIASSKKEGTAEIAVLVALGRQGLGLDPESTSNNEVRKWAQELGRYDAKHFGDHLQLADSLLKIVGKGSKRRFSVKWNELEQLRELLTRVAQRG